jgi:ferritin-like metal-binding protein YciE
VDKLEMIIRLTADSLSKARQLSKIALDERPELRIVAAQIMKTVKATHEKIEALNEASQRNGKLDKATLDEARDRILKAAQEINHEVDDLLARTRW